MVAKHLVVAALDERQRLVGQKITEGTSLKRHALKRGPERGLESGLQLGEEEIIGEPDSRDRSFGGGRQLSSSLGVG